MVTTKIIIISDGKNTNIESINQYLTEHGYEVIIANDGLDGFNLARKETPDIVLIESVLSGFNGYQLCSLLKYDIKFEDITVVILANGAGTKEQLLANSCGADGVFSTPIDLDELTGLIRSINYKEQ